MTCKLSFRRFLVLIKGGVEIRKSCLACLTNFLELLYMTSCCGEINLRYLEGGPSGARQLSNDVKKMNNTNRSSATSASSCCSRLRAWSGL